MPACIRKQHNALHKPSGPAQAEPRQARKSLCLSLRKALCTCLACLSALVAPGPADAADAPRPVVGEAYIFNQVAGPHAGQTPDNLLERTLRGGTLRAGEIADPSSRPWAGAQGLSLRLEQAATLLASNVIASTGDGHAAAASHADGRIRVFGAGNCTTLAMPEGHPAYALALAKGGGVLAAWAQGVNRIAFFDLRAPGCPATSVETAMSGAISMTLSASGSFLAAQDSSGSIWLGPRGGEPTDSGQQSTEPRSGTMRRVATLPGAPAAIGFSNGEGVLLVIDAQGRGGSWNPRTGKALRTVQIPGGPFARGEFQGTEARLWSTDGRLVRWNILHNRPVHDEPEAFAANAPGPEGWLELRGTDLFYARAARSWRPEPLYEPRLPQLTHSRHATCLRLSDVDGQIRYFDARTGLPRAQCFADDWNPVAVQADGTAQIPGLKLRIYDTTTMPGAGPGTGYTINLRAISETRAYLWLDSPPNPSLRVQTPPQPSAKALQKATEAQSQPAPETITIPLRQGISATAPASLLRLN